MGFATSIMADAIHRVRGSRWSKPILDAVGFSVSDGAAHLDLSLTWRYRSRAASSSWTRDCGWPEAIFSNVLLSQA